MNPYEGIEYEQLISDAEKLAQHISGCDTEPLDSNSDVVGMCDELARRFEAKYHLLNSYGTHLSEPIVPWPVRPENHLLLRNPEVHVQVAAEDDKGDGYEYNLCIPVSGDVIVEYVDVLNDIQRVKKPGAGAEVYDRDQPEYYIGPHLYSLIGLSRIEDIQPGDYYATAKLRDVTVSPNHHAYILN